MSKTETRTRILMDAVSKAGAANYLHVEIVEAMITEGLLYRDGEFVVRATPRGFVLFTTGK